MRLAIIADTHMPRGSRRLPDECIRRVRAADLILHLGDFSEASVLADLKGLGPPLVGVCGNVDSAELRRLLPQEAEVDAAGARLGLVHDAGPAKARLERMRERFPAADAVLFGHSHLPLHERDESGFQIFNPGSPTERRRAPHRSMGIAEARDGTIAFEHVRLPEPSLP